MKKMMFLAALFAALTFSSCGGNKTSDATDAAADTTALDANGNSVVDPEAAAITTTEKLDSVLNAKDADPAAVKEAVASIEQKIEELKASGNTEAAAAYASKVKTYLTEHAEEIKKIDPTSVTVLDVVNAATNLPANATDAAKEAANAVTSDAAAAKEAAKTAAGAAKSAAESAAKSTVDNAKNKATSAAASATSAATKKVESAKSDAKKKADDAVQKGATKAAGAINKALGY